jgi:hypothetical protein
VNPLTEAKLRAVVRVLRQRAAACRAEAERADATSAALLISISMDRDAIAGEIERAIAEDIRDEITGVHDLRKGNA